LSSLTNVFFTTLTYPQAKTELCATVSIYSGRLAFRPDTNRTALE